MRALISRLFHRFRTPINVVAALVVIALVVVLRGRTGGVEPVEQGPTLPLVISGPESIGAGDDWPLSIEGRTGALETDAETLDVHVTGPWGVRSLHLERPDDWTVTIPGELTRRTGVLSATVRIGDAVGTGFVAVAPHDAIDGAIPLAGPRSIVADFEHHTMVSAFPRDRYGNSVSDGTVVTVHVRRPDGTVDEVETEVAHLLAAVRVSSESLAGRTALRMDTEGATGPEVEILEVPGPPVGVSLIAPETPLRADGRMLVNVRSDVLTDEYGNVLFDGTSGVVRMEGPLGLGTLRPVTIDGRFDFYIEAPPLPGTVTVDIEVDGVRSDPITLEFASDVSELPVAAELTDEGVVVTVGEVLSVHGGFVPDGTIAWLRIGTSEMDEDIIDGRAEFVVAIETIDELDADEMIEIEVLGTIVEVEAP